MNRVNVLVISNKYDFATDYVCLELQQRAVEYLRINRDEFEKYEITLDVLKCSMEITINNELHYIDQNHLRSIYYRAPIYLRDIYRPGISKQEQLYRTQWASFIRNLTIFEDAVWVNNPISTFKAENKMLQLKYAHQVGLKCPKTVITNTNRVCVENEKTYIVKSLDTAILRIDDKEAFVYSNKITGEEIQESSLSLAPIMLQDYIMPKTDIRVTVVGTMVYAVKILKEGKGVEGDWRLIKNSIDFVPFDLPKEINNKCLALMEKLCLAFGGIDLIQCNNDYYFIEINPTGEWAWLVKSANLEIFKGICDFLEGESCYQM